MRSQRRHREADLSWPAAVFFDLDGCLVDSTRAITRCLNHALDAVGLASRPVAELRRFVGPPLFEAFATLLSEADADAALAHRCVDAYRDVYGEVALRDTELIAGVPELLDRLHGRFPLAVVTSKPWSFAVPVLEAVDLAARFVAVHAPELDDLVEPKTTTLGRALDAVVPDAAMRSTVMVGDRSHDVLAGRACGAVTVGVTWGAGGRDELVSAGADHLVDVPDELAGLLLD